VQTEGDDLPEETKTFVVEYMVPKLKKLSADLGNTPLYILKKYYETRTNAPAESIVKSLQPVHSKPSNQSVNSAI
jgi:hypothetical protein